MKGARRASGWLLGVLLPLGLGACQAVAGIEDRELDPEAAAALETTAACKSYCKNVMEACQGKNAVYTTEELCLGVCKLLDPGDPLEPVGDTLACRAHQAKIAELEPDDNCRSAGPGGDGQCGSDCDAYCTLFEQACPDDNDYPDHESCLQACSGLTDQRRFDVVEDHEGDSIECRLVHVSSATVNPSEHCAHAPVIPTEPWCIGKADESPTCEEYCNIELAACQGELAQYESPKQCLDACTAFDLGMNEDQAGNTIACRRYHSFSATLGADQHCPHSGPAGDGHCGDHGKLADGSETTGNCESYCQLLRAACSDQFDASFGDDDSCMQECIPLDEAEPESRYTVARAKDSTGVSCRILHAVRAFEDDTACDAAVGGDPCN